MTSRQRRLKMANNSASDAQACTGVQQQEWTRLCRDWGLATVRIWELALGGIERQWESIAGEDSRT